jgi:hypothetical protein
MHSCLAAWSEAFFSLSPMHNIGKYCDCEKIDLKILQINMFSAPLNVKQWVLEFSLSLCMCT